MTMKKYLLALSLVGVLGLPSVSYAATYFYIDITGAARSVEANSSSEALAIVNAMPNTLHSGVTLDQGFIEEGENYGNLYQYRTTAGTTAVVRAATIDAAALLATDRDPSSGFVIMP